LKCDNKLQIAPLKFENGFFIFEILKCKGDLNIKKLTKKEVEKMTVKVGN